MSEHDNGLDGYRCIKCGANVNDWPDQPCVEHDPSQTRWYRPANEIRDSRGASAEPVEGAAAIRGIVLAALGKNVSSGEFVNALTERLAAALGAEPYNGGRQMQTTIPGITAMHAVITPNCRNLRRPAVHSDPVMAAFEVAVDRLRGEYRTIARLRGTGDGFVAHVVLTIENGPSEEDG